MPLPRIADAGPTGAREAYRQAPEAWFDALHACRFSERAQLGAGLRYVDEQFIAPDNGFTIDDYVVVHATLGYKTENWGATLRVDNLTDEEYYGRGSGSTSVRPEDEIGVTLRLEYSF